MEILKHIVNNHFSVQYICSHQSLITISDVIAIRGEEMHVDDVELKTRCTNCKSKGVFTRFQIIHTENSVIALLGSEVQE